MNRAVGVISAVLWVGLMAALVQRDVLPMWTAQEAPTQSMPKGRYQVAIQNIAGIRVGTSWIVATEMPSASTVSSITELDFRRIPALAPVARPLMLQSELSYDADDRLEDFTFNLHGTGMPIQVEGGRYGHDFACTATIGRMQRTIPLDGRMSNSLGESLRPFTHLPNLAVGQRWCVRLLDPLALLNRESLQFKMYLAEVTARQTIEHLGEQVPCFRVEMPGTVAWADETGRVLRQEVELPLLGTWVLEDEPFDKAVYEAVAAECREMKRGRKLATADMEQP